MRTLLGILIFVAGYLTIYYRLLVNYFYEREHGVKEGRFGVVFSPPPPPSRLPERARPYARRYWLAVAFLLGCVILLAMTTDFSAWRPAS